MSLLVRAAVAAGALVALATAPAARAAAPVPLEAGKAITFPFPAKAPVVVQLNGHGSTRDRLGVLLKAALPDEADVLGKFIDFGIKELLGERKLTAIPKDGRVFLVVNDIANLFENTPAFSVLVPVTGYKEFRDSFLTADERKAFEAGKNGVDEFKAHLFGDDRTLYMVDLKEYVAISPDKATADIYANKYTKATTDAMPFELAKSFVGSDLAVYVNLDVINDLYGDKIRDFKGLIEFAIQQAAMGGMVPGVNKKQLETIKSVFQGTFQAIEDARGVVVGIELRPEGLNFRIQAQFVEDSTSAKALKNEIPAPLADLGKLPAGLAQYTGSKFGQKFHDTLRGLNPEFAPADDDEKGNAALARAHKRLAEAGSLGDVTAAGAPEMSVTFSAYTDPKKAAAALIECYESVAAGGRVQNVILKDAPKVTGGAKKHRSFDLTEVRLVFDFEATVKDLPDGLKETTLAQIKNLVSEKATIWIGTDGKTVIQAMGKDWDSVAAAIDGFLDGKKPLSGSDGYKLTRKNLPPDANYMLFLETGQTLNTLIDTMRSLSGVIPGFPKIAPIKPVKGEPSYVGLSVTLKGDAASLNVFIPAAAIGSGRNALEGILKKVE
jgi:hypothetical protein